MRFSPLWTAEDAVEKSGTELLLAERRRAVRAFFFFFYSFLPMCDFHN